MLKIMAYCSIRYVPRIIFTNGNKVSFQSITIFSCQADFPLLPFWRPSFSKFLSIQAVSSYILQFIANVCTFFTISSSKDPTYSNKVNSRVSNISSGDPHHFHAQASSGTPHFLLCSGTYLPNCGVSAPGGGGGGTRLIRYTGVYMGDFFAKKSLNMGYGFAENP